MWGYLLLVFISQIINPITQSLSFSTSLRFSAKGVNGLLDLIFNKLMVISDQARSTSASGNLTNLLFTDTQKIAMMFQYFPIIIQVPFELVIYIVYLGVQIDPIALCGLLVYLVFFPLIGVIMGNAMTLEKQIMSLKDLRVNRAGEVLNGIKVIKLFNLEKI